ncbi:hypothetical protein [Variovorax sp. PBL-H6]|uniref:hypothetical protein n=2 Tax=Variovorax TaxID=34072 RepID=UPI0013A55397|nr:hypothetical protein [Variovorax sp. PBL-H6]
MTLANARPSVEEHPEIPHAKRYECRWRDDPARPGRQVHYWVDNAPTQPHWPESAVMRWDLRQSDWHLIWPELIDHPCAKLFAPTHPDRKGPRRFRDWVESWPEGFAWRSELPGHLHPAIEKALKELSEGLALEGDPVGATPALQGPQSSGDAAAALRPAGLDVPGLVESLAVALHEVNDGDRPAIAQALSTLAMAPDSGRTLEALKNLLKP